MKKRDADARQKVVCWMLVDEGEWDSNKGELLIKRKLRVGKSKAC